MNPLFEDIIEFFGIGQVPVNLGELIPWLMSVFVAMAVVLFVMGMISQLVRGLNR